LGGNRPAQAPGVKNVQEKARRAQKIGWMAHFFHWHIWNLVDIAYRKLIVFTL
jgi:hypothetical protein